MYSGNHFQAVESLIRQLLYRSYENFINFVFGFAFSQTIDYNVEYIVLETGGKTWQKKQRPENYMQ